MLLAQGSYWRVSLTKGADQVVVALLSDALPEAVRDVRELKIPVPLDQWNRVVKQVRLDRKLTGGILLDLAQNKDHVPAAVGNDRLFGELQRVVIDATTSLVEQGALSLRPVDVGAD